MEFRSIPKQIAPEDISLESAEIFLEKFDSFATLSDSNKRMPTIRKTGEAARFLFSGEQCKEFVPKMLETITKEDIVSIKVIAIKQLIYFIEKCKQNEISLFEELFAFIKELLQDDAEEVVKASCDVMKKLGEYLTEENTLNEYLEYLDSLIENRDGFISTIGLELLNYFAAKTAPENVKKFIVERLKKMSENVQFTMRKGAVGLLPAVFTNINDEDKNEVVEIYDRLTKDSVFSVRKSTAMILVDILSIFEENKQKVVEYIEKFIDDSSKYVKFQIISNFGKLSQFIGKELMTDKIIEYYISNCTNESDSEQQYYAAYYFVSLLQCIGVEKWNVVMESFNALALSIHWKNRKCFASSLHLMAKILGDEITLSHIIPALDKYLSDYDEIKQIAMMHIVDFVPILGQERGVKILTLLQTNVQSNDWRIRQSIARQMDILAQALPNYAQHIEEICIKLLIDTVSKVRHTIAKRMGEVINAFLNCGYVGVSSLIAKLLDMANDPLKIRRIDFVTIATSLFVSLPPDQFVPEILPALQISVADKVSQVRCAVATCVKKVMEGHEYFVDEVKNVVNVLANDEDEDVRTIMEQGALTLFKRKEEKKSVVQDPCDEKPTFEGFGRK